MFLHIFNLALHYTITAAER